MTSPEFSFTKVLPDGRRAVISRFLAFWSIEIDGRPYMTGALGRTPWPKGPYTHISAGDQRFDLTPEDVTQVEEILKAEHAAELATPKGRRKILVRERSNAIRDWSNMRAYVAEGRRGAGDLAAAEAAMEAAVEAVLRFNAENPGAFTHEDEEEDRQIPHQIRHLRSVRYER